MTGDPRVLAADLAERDDAALARLFAERVVSAHAPWRDFFDAAEGLLDPASVDRALIRMPRAELAALAAAIDHRASVDDPERRHLADLALLRPDGVPYRVTAAQVRALARDRPDAFAAAASSGPAEPSSVDEAAAAAERAALSAAALADILLAALHAPLARTGAGAISAADRRRLLDGGAVSSPDELDDLLDTAVAAGLATPVEREWLVTENGMRWLDSPTGRRWEVVAEGFRSVLPTAVRTDDGGFRTSADWPSVYPLAPGWATRCAQLVSMARRWGLFAPSGSEPPWTATIRAGGPADSGPLVALLPGEIDRLYLQADLSAIAPGPLSPHVDLRLRTMASRESRAQASTYRFTADSVAAAVAAGETAATLRDFLSTVSLTGIPQPLEYLIETAAARHGLIRVLAEPRSGRTRVESDDAAVLDTLAVDQAVRPIGLVREPDGLSSRVARDAVYWTLVDARYPVVAIDPDGAPESIVRRRLASAADTAAGEPHRRLIAGLRESHGTDVDAAWLGRELDAAVRTRSAVTIVVTMPDGAPREFTIEATGLGGGRLRGRERGSETERTLPVSSIVSVRPAS